MDDVSFSWRIEMNERCLRASDNPDELRRIGMDCIALMRNQRLVLRQVLEEWGK